MDTLSRQEAQEALQAQSRSPLVPWTLRIEGAEALDPVGDRIASLVQPLISNPRLRDALRGQWLSHALHPVLTDFPLGAWTCTSLLDLFGGRRSRPAAQGLLAFGLVAAVPTVLSGVAEWSTTTGSERRVGVAHAGLNTVAAGLYGTSFMARRRGRHVTGVTLALAGGVVAVVSGYLGGHLSLARKVGTRDPAFHGHLAQPRHAEATGPQASVSGLGPVS